MKFTEKKLEKAFTELLGQERFPHHLGITISRKPEEVLIEEPKNLPRIDYFSVRDQNDSTKITSRINSFS